MRDKSIIVYHGSDRIIAQPDTEHSRLRVDFGKGFYTTPFYEQAKKWCEKYTTRRKSGIISYYELDVSVYKECAVLSFEAYAEAWLDFILKCRAGTMPSDYNRYDIIEGGIANDKVFNTVELYFENLIDKTEAIKRLRYEKPNMQIALRTDAALTCLKYMGCEKI